MHRYLQNNICYFRSPISPWRGPQSNSLFRTLFINKFYIFTMPKINMDWGPLQPFLSIDHDFGHICFLKKLWNFFGTTSGTYSSQQFICCQGPFGNFLKFIRFRGHKLPWKKCQIASMLVGPFPRSDLYIQTSIPLISHYHHGGVCDDDDVTNKLNDGWGGKSDGGIEQWITQRPIPHRDLYILTRPLVSLYHQRH